MLDVYGRTAVRSVRGVSRRDFLRVGALGAMGLGLSDWLKMKASASDNGGAAKEAPAKSVIQLWMAGGPTHLDTWDPKPDAGDE